MTTEDLNRLKMLDTALCAQMQAADALHDLLTTIIEHEKLPARTMKIPRRIKMRKA